MNAIYLRRRKKVHLAGAGTEAGAGANEVDACPLAVVATMQKNLEPLGFILSEALFRRLLSMGEAKVATVYKALVKDVREMVGAHRDFHPMYPDFPEQVMKASEAELYFNAMLHYLTERLPAYEKNPRSELEEFTLLRVIDLGSREDFETIFTRLCASRASLSCQDRDDVKWFITQYRDDIQRLLPKAVPQKETAAFVAASLMQHTTVAPAFIAAHLKTPTDVLRLAVALSEGDVSLAVKCRFKPLNRRMRRLILSTLEAHGNPLEDMLRWKERWKRLGERLHPGDYTKEYPKTHAAFRVLRNDLPAETFASKVEQALRARDTTGALAVLRRRPGDLARRLDHLLRLGVGADEVFADFEAGADAVSTPVLLQLRSHFAQRDQLADLRAFFPKGDTAKVYGRTDVLPPLPREVTRKAVSIVDGALLRRFVQMPPLGRCYLDPALATYLVPFSQRSASKSLHTVGRGSRMPLPEGKVLRFFLWWKNGTSRTDIDLSAVLYSREYKFIDSLAYYNLKNFGGCHSGDIVDAPQGAAEFIDVEIGRLLENDVRYIIMCLNSFTRQPYCDLPECFAGWMSRESAGSGEIFEARTVQNKTDIAANTAICLPAIFDLGKREVIW